MYIFVIHTNILPEVQKGDPNYPNSMLQGGRGNDSCEPGEDFLFLWRVSVVSCIELMWCVHYNHICLYYIYYKYIYIYIVCIYMYIGVYTHIYIYYGYFQTQGQPLVKPSLDKSRWLVRNPFIEFTVTVDIPVPSCWRLLMQQSIETSDGKIH